MKPTRYGRGKVKLMESSSGATAGSPSIETNRHQAAKIGKGRKKETKLSSRETRSEGVTRSSEQEVKKGNQGEFGQSRVDR